MGRKAFKVLYGMSAGEEKKSARPDVVSSKLEASRQHTNQHDIILKHVCFVSSTEASRQHTDQHIPKHVCLFFAGECAGAELLKHVCSFFAGE